MLRGFRVSKWHGMIMVCLLSVALGLAGCAGKSQSHKYRSEIEEAESDFESQRNAPPTAKTLYAMGDVLAAQGKDREAEFIFRRCIQEFPYYLPAYNSLAELYTRQGRNNEAIELLAKALDIHERDPVVLNNLGICYLIRRDYEHAFKYFLSAASVIPSKERYRANMATALGMLGRDEEALALLKQVLSPEEAKHNAKVLQRARIKSQELIAAES